MTVYLFTDADFGILDKLYRGILSTAEARVFLERTLGSRCDWADQHRCIDGAVRGGYATLARAAILAGESRVLISLLEKIEHEAAEARAQKFPPKTQ
ncbi:MAG: hypothetical protein IT406_03965 [Candidatus Yanofskybacteria bacterium]|nr:hypothetical protein [Candidatus Yanofskybacteria bacterium]